MPNDSLSLQEKYAPNNACWGCGPANNEGLRIRSFPEGDGEVVAEWKPAQKYEAFPGVLNGGIIGTLLDCHCNWTAAYFLMKQAGEDRVPCTVTADYAIKLLRPTPTNDAVFLSAKVVESSSRSRDDRGHPERRRKVCATCRGTFVAVKEGHPAYPSMVGALLAATLLAVAAAPPNDQAADRIAALEKQQRLVISAWPRSIPATGRKIEYRPNERFLMCSTFKALAAAAVLQRVDEGKDHLDRFVSYGEKDMLEYAPVTKAHVQEGGMKLGDLCAAAVELSDNTAGNLILQSIGGPRGLTQASRGAWATTMTRLDRMEPELNSVAPDPTWDTTTPAAMRDDWVKILTTNVLSAKSREQLETWLARQSNRHKTDSRRRPTDIGRSATRPAGARTARSMTWRFCIRRGTADFSRDLFHRA